ncbi:MAG: DUF1015 domain-containing protein [Cyanobacteriota bacterium]
MVKISPFEGITFNFNKLSSEYKLFAPPYDVISPAYQEELYSRNPYNIVRLILPKALDGDNDLENRYTRAAKDYKRWLERGILVKSPIPKLYFYVQQYKDSKGFEVLRKGFIAKCLLEDFETGNILPHEETMGGPKEDRLNLMTASKANFSQIFVVYSDIKQEIDYILEMVIPPTPLVDVVDDDRVRHIFYEITDEPAIAKIQDLMKDKKILIADGHHRYETALKYRDNRRAEDCSDISEENPYDSMMIYFANLEDTGLRIYPTHRLLKTRPGISFEQFLKKIDPSFSVLEINFDSIEKCFSLIEKEDASEIPIGVICKENPGKLYLIKPCLEKVTEELSGLGVSDILAKLDVTILHRLILEKIMGLDTIELKNQNNIQFIRNEDEIVSKYSKHEAEYIFLLTSPDISKVKEVCLGGFRMPQKSTYFYPKLLSGLVLNSLE